MSEIKLKKGDKVVMHTCIESKGKNFGKVWTCETDSFRCEAGIEVVYLEGFSGFFSTLYLQPVDLRILEMENSRRYKYEKCINCVHAHMDKNGSHNCGFMDCVSEQDKKYPDDTPFESYMSCYDCFQEIVKLNKAKEIISKIIIAVTEGIPAVIPPIIAEAEQFLKENKK